MFHCNSFIVFVSHRKLIQSSISVSIYFHLFFYYFVLVQRLVNSLGSLFLDKTFTVFSPKGMEF